jgi:hypothetical protein
MDAGTVWPINASSDGTPNVVSIASTSLGEGPMWRAAKSAARVLVCAGMTDPCLPALSFVPEKVISSAGSCGATFQMVGENRGGPFA